MMENRLLDICEHVIKSRGKPPESLEKFYEASFLRIGDCSCEGSNLVIDQMEIAYHEVFGLDSEDVKKFKETQHG